MKKIFSVLFLFFICGQLLSQSNWAKKIGGTSNEEILDATYDNNGNIILVGYLSGHFEIGGTHIITSGNSDILVMKFSGTGDLIWAKKAGGTGPDRAFSVTVDALNNIYITGYFYNNASFGSIDITGQDRDVFAAKMDPDGDFLWAVNFGGETGETGYGIEVDNLNNVYVTGQYKGLGVFGTETFTSTINPETGLHVYDFFLTKLNSTGNFVWTRVAQAKYDDRGLSLTIDEDRNIYVAGQFSDTIIFENTHNNYTMNSGFIIKYDESGNEIWFNILRAGQTILYDIKWKNDKIYLTGDFKGAMNVLHTGGSSVFTNSGQYKVLISQFNEDGNLSWFKSNFSENEITAKQLAIDNNNDVYVSGMFKCDFTEMNQIHGNSTFLSVGYRDVFYMKYSKEDDFQWARQIGGDKDDFCSSIIVKNVDFPVIAGSYSGQLVFPADSSFVFPSSIPYSAVENCGDVNYGNFVQLNNSGNRDIFLSSPFDITRLPYDYYIHDYSLACDLDTLVPCIQFCADSIEICYNASNSVSVNHFQREQPIRPIYNYLWNTGNTNQSQNVSVNGTYSVKISREDGCSVYHDTVYVYNHPIPLPPLITDAWGYNFNQPPSTTKIDTCTTDSLFIYAIAADTLTETINWSHGIHYDDSTIIAPISGVYHVQAISAFGCVSMSNSLEFIRDDFALNDTFNPHIILIPEEFSLFDSIPICQDEGLCMFLIDSNFIHPMGYFPYKYSLWYVDGVLKDSIRYYPNEYEEFCIPASELDTGWHNVTAHLVNECGDTVDYFMEKNIYIYEVPIPTANFITATPGDACPGDSVMIYGYTDPANIITWFGPNIIENYGDSILVLVTYSTAYYTATIDTITPFITCSNDFTVVIVPPPTPEIIMIPDHGIVCPGEDVELIALSGIAWEWYGPEGGVLGTDENIFVGIPGTYHAVITLPNGCIMTSNFVEMKEFNTPFLMADPFYICEGETSTLEVIAQPNVIINWLPPLSGTSYTQTVDTPGVYYVELTGCGITHIDSVTILTATPEAIILLIGDSLICPNDEVSLYGTSGMIHYSWNGDESGESMIVVSDTGYYVLMVENEFGCKAYSDTLWINYLSNPAKPILADTTICLGTDVWLIPIASDTIYWFDGDENFITSADSLLFSSVTENTTIFISNKDEFCHSDFSEMNIFIHESSTFPIFDMVDVFCQYDSVNFQTVLNDTSITVEWILPDLTIIETNAFSIDSIQTIHQGIYGVHYSDENCSSDTAYINIIINEFPFVNIYSFSDSLFCPGDSVLIFANTNADSLVWFDHFSTDTLAYYLNPGLVYYTGYNNGCGSVSDSIYFAWKEVIETIGQIDTFVCEGNSIQLFVDSTYQVTWYSQTMDSLHTGGSFTTSNLLMNTQYFIQSVDLTNELCKSEIFEININVVSSDFIPAYSTYPSPVCLNDSIFILADETNFTNYYWLIDGVQVSTDTILTLDINSLDSIFISYYVSNYGCVSDTAYIEIPVQPLPFVEIFALDTLICPFTPTIIYTNTNADNVYWSNGYETDSIIVFDSDYYYYIGELNGCYTVSDTVFIDYLPISSPPFVPDVFVSVCQGSSALLIASHLDEITWFDADFNLVYSGDLYNTPPLDSSTYYYVQATTDGLCPSELQVVYVFVIPTEFTPDYTVSPLNFCLGESITFSGYNYIDSIAYQYNWIYNGDTITNSEFFTFFNDSLGDFQISLYFDYAGCESMVNDINFTVNPLPHYDLPIDTVLCFEEILVLDIDFDYFYYSTTSAGTIFDSTLYFTYTNEFGCKNYDTIEVKYVDCSLFVPNVFSPNNDGINDYFSFKISKGEVLYLTIYNRWGNVMYESEDVEWDGTTKSGNEATEGVYYFVVEYKMFDEKIEKASGFFHLVR